jgi:hypothetical protein
MAARWGDPPLYERPTRDDLFLLAFIIIGALAGAAAYAIGGPWTVAWLVVVLAVVWCMEVTRCGRRTR